jgi:uncharacterized membrane protein YgaE (UPF0421/DUF939 family)
VNLWIKIFVKFSEMVDDIMKHLHKHYWFGRLLASDPGRKRLQHAGKATISLISSVFTTMFFLRVLGINLITPAIISGLVGMLGIIVVMDDTKHKKKVTTFLIGISATVGITTGSLITENPIYFDLLLILIICSSFYFSRFGIRYFSICMIGFMTVYISTILKLAPDQLQWFYLGIISGIAYAYFYNFILFKDSVQILKSSIQSFHIQINITFNILIQLIQVSTTSPKQVMNLEKNVHKLREYAKIVSDELNIHDVNEIWPGIAPAQLRLYIFDTGMLVETLTDTIKRLKKADALETEKIRSLLVWVVQSLRDVEVLSQYYETENLEKAEKAIQALRIVINDLIKSEERPKGWLFLIRRIESIANHVIEAAITIQQGLHQGNFVEFPSSEKEETAYQSKNQKNDKGLKPSTKKAFQALIAGALSIIIGKIISPTQPYWILLTAFLVLLGTESIGRTYMKGFQRSLGTVFGAVLGFAFAKLVSGNAIIEMLLLFCVVFLAYYLLTVSYTLMSMFITMLIAFMYDMLLGGITLELLEARVLDTIVGATIAYGVSVIIFPKKTKDRVNDAIDDFLAELKPYVTQYVKSFIEHVDVKGLADRTFSLAHKLQSIKDESRTLLQRPGFLYQSSYARWITVLTTINYFAKHLVASTYRKNFDYPDDLKEIFQQIESKMDNNIEILRNLIKGIEHNPTFYSLDKEREKIEHLSPSRYKSQLDLIHHLYYVWRINQSIIVLGTHLGAKVISTNIVKSNR